MRGAREKLFVGLDGGRRSIAAVSVNLNPVPKQVDAWGRPITYTTDENGKLREVRR